MRYPDCWEPSLHMHRSEIWNSSLSCISPLDFLSVLEVRNFICDTSAQLNGHFLPDLYSLGTMWAKQYPPNKNLANGILSLLFLSFSVFVCFTFSLLLIALQCLWAVYVFIFRSLEFVRTRGLEWYKLCCHYLNLGQYIECVWKLLCVLVSAT